LEVPGRCLAFTDPCFPPGHGLSLTIFSAGLQIWSWTGAGEKEKSHRRRRVMGDLAGLAGQRVLLPDSGEQRRGALLLGLVSLLSKSGASAASPASPTALPHFLLVVTSLVPSPPRSGGGETSKHRNLGCTVGVLVVCILS